MNIASLRLFGKQSFLLKEITFTQGRRWGEKVSVPRVEGASCLYNKGMFCLKSLIISPNHQTWSAAGGSVVALRNRECFCEGKEMHGNFLQESTGTDKVKIYSFASCLMATSYTLSVTEIKLIFYSCKPCFLSVGLRPRGPLFLQSLFFPRPFPRSGPFPKWQYSCLPVWILVCSWEAVSPGTFYSTVMSWVLNLLKCFFCIDWYNCMICFPFDFLTLWIALIVKYWAILISLD